MPILTEDVLNQYGHLTVEQFLQQQCEAQVTLSTALHIAPPPVHSLSLSLSLSLSSDRSPPSVCSTATLIRQIALVRSHAASLVADLQEKTKSAREQLMDSATAKPGKH